jgi:thiamine-phosphate pyrophosphorylase
MITCFGLYVILTDPVAGYEHCAEAAVKAGVKVLQLRMKYMPFARVLEVAKAIKQITAGTGTLFIVNDDVRIAGEVDADGVHLGQEDMSLPEARALWNEPGKIYGLSTHNKEQVKRALDLKPDYIGVGPVYKTPTKEKPDPVLGLNRMGHIIQATSLPAVAIGGITLDNIKEVLGAGAINFAAVRAIMESENPAGVIKAFMTVWEEMVCKKRELPG